MADRNLTEKIEILEEKVQTHETLPARVGAVEMQILQLRDEMRGEFSAVRQEMRAMRDELRAEIRAGDKETRVQMRVLHEEVIARIATLQESRPRRRR
jgi:hypothetical protein